jgi:putative endonuclease
MYWTYILESELDGRYYIGQTNNIEDRLKRHNRGYEKYTKKYLPRKLVYTCSFETRSEAMELEKNLKRSKSRSYIQKYIEQYS